MQLDTFLLASSGLIHQSHYICLSTCACDTVRRRTLTAGDVFGEVAFFTEVTQHEGIRSTTVCRVLTIPRAGYTTIAQSFPIGARNVLDNLLAKAQQVIDMLTCTASYAPACVDAGIGPSQ